MSSTASCLGGEQPKSPDNLKEAIMCNLRIAPNPVNHFSPSPQRPQSPIVADARRRMASRREASHRILEQLQIERAPQRQISRELVGEAREKNLARLNRSRRERRVA